MFTGIIGSIGVIESARQEGDLTVKIACYYKPDSMKPGDSIAVNGVCLTVVASDKWQATSKKETACHLPLATCHFAATLSAETLNRTAPGQWEKDRKVNLERALKMGDALDGHLVTGHVDGVATIKDITISGDSHIVCLEAPQELARFIAEKGSVALDGISLTVNKIENNRFWVNIIPHSWQHTTLSECKPGDGLNLEIDLIARYTARLLSTRH